MTTHRTYPQPDDPAPPDTETDAPRWPGGPSAKTFHQASPNPTPNHQDDSKETAMTDRTDDSGPVNEPGKVFTNAPANGPVNGPVSGPEARVYEFPHRASSPVHDPSADPPDNPGDGSDAPPEATGIVVDGEVIGEPTDSDSDSGSAAVDGSATVATRPRGVLVIRQAGTTAVRGTGKAVTTVYATTRQVVTHPHTKTGTKLAARNLWYPAAGTFVVIKRWRDTHGASRYERMMRAAELAGDREALFEWEARDVAEKARRHGRVMDWVRSPVELLKAAGFALLGFTGLLLALGVVLAFANSDIKMVIGPITAVIKAIAFMAWFLSVYGVTLLIAGTVCGVAYLWHTGRVAAESTPTWLRSDAQRDDEVGALLTADGIMRALMHLPIPALKAAFKQGWTPRFELTPTREGQGSFRGFRAIFDLPDGVTPKMVTDVRDVLAKNLHRNAVEVWPSDYGREKGGKAGYVNLYAADSGVMDKPTPEYPLLNDGVADVFEGVPIGITQRGDTVMMPIVGSNGVFGGQPGQGKSNAVRVAVAGVALDPLAEIRVHVFALNGDFDAYQPRLSRYEKGATAEHVASAGEHLGELFDEVGRREGRLAELGAKKLTRAIAERNPDMRPMLVVFSECHEMFSHAEHGKLAAELAIAVVKRGRKTGVSLLFDTQSARTQAIPSQLVENVGFNGCFAVKAWRSNDGFLGDGSFAAGIRATELRFNVDRGTMVATGASEELFEIVRTFFIRVDDDAGWDQASEIIERAMDQLVAGTPVHTDRPPVTLVPERRDLLDDLHEVLPDTERVPAGDALGALRNLAPKWKPYTEFTVPSFVAQLAELGIKVPRTGNKYPVDPVTVREIRDARARSETGTEGE